MAKKPPKSVGKPSKAAAKTATKAKNPAKAAKPAEAPAQPDQTQAAAAPAPQQKPAVPPKPVPAHQQFLSKGSHGGLKNQHMAKGRIFRHQGR
jgi:hypothetical protein